MKALPRWRVHELMQQQALDRRETGRPLQAGDYIQAHVGGEIRIVAGTAYSAGECLEARAMLLALHRPTERNEFERG